MKQQGRHVGPAPFRPFVRFLVEDPFGGKSQTEPLQVVCGHPLHVIEAKN